MKIKILAVLALFSILVSCEESIEYPLTPEETKIVDYFNTIALGFEFGNASDITRKWNSDMQIYIHGTPSSQLLVELDDIIAEINVLATDDFEVLIVDNESFANFHIYFVGHEEYGAEFPSVADLLENNLGLFLLDWSQNTNDLNWGTMYVDILRLTELEPQKHFLREELTQSLGLANDSDLYPESIFYQSSSSTTEYSDLDKEVIRLLYHPSMVSGLTEGAATEVVTDILLGER